MNSRRLYPAALAGLIVAIILVGSQSAWAKRCRRAKRSNAVCCCPVRVCPTPVTSVGCASPIVALAAPQNGLSPTAPTPAQAPTVVPTQAPTPASKPGTTQKGISLFDGKTLKNWKPTKFGGEGEVTVKDGAIQMEFGYSLSGITYDGKAPLPKTNYEISLEARRIDGIDFFCALTFPVEDSHCSFVVGGWAGAVVGLSSIDGMDASENDTTTYADFKTGKWYRVRVRVTDEYIMAWIDDKQVVKQEVKGHRIGIRPEVDLNCPLGICAWETKAQIRNIRLLKLDPKPAPATK